MRRCYSRNRSGGVNGFTSPLRRLHDLPFCQNWTRWRRQCSEHFWFAWELWPSPSSVAHGSDQPVSPSRTKYLMGIRNEVPPAYQLR